MQVQDRQLLAYGAFDARIREQLRALISEELIAEHASAPLGPHSDALARVVNYFRRQPQAGKYIVFADKAWESYGIAQLTGNRGEAPRVVSDDRYETEEAAMHAVFLLRVQSLQEDAQ